ncbi:hypothetical protein AAE478_004904 [Parahypoxylon ruwenzoriense]
MAAFPWKDPLGGIIIEKHPTPETSVLSSAISDPNVFYDCMENVDKVLDSYVPNAALDDDDTTRVLWHAVHNLPRLGSLQLMAEILEIGRDHEKLRQLRNFLVDAVLKPSSSFVALLRRDDRENRRPFSFLIRRRGGRHNVVVRNRVINRDDQAAFKKKYLRRDGYCCLLSGKFDIPSRREELYHRNPGEIGTFTQCCHILPFALRKFNEENAMEEEDNKYQLHTFRYESEPLPPFITFTSHDPTVPLPDRDFLSAHYVVAKILNGSGLIHKIPVSDWPVSGGVRSLKPDGSTDIAEILSRRLLIDI